MKKLHAVAISALVLALLNCSLRDESAVSLRIMTFNIRCNSASDGPNAWPNRKDKAAGMILFHQADLVGIQEGLPEQVDDLAARLPGYAWIGVGRDDGVRQGEFMAIFYSTRRFKIIRSATFWLSEHPDTPGKGWDAACNRVVTWGEFKDLRTGKRFYHFNTHFDHVGETARQESAKLLLTRIRDLAGNAPVIVTGDFNSAPDSTTCKILTGGELPAASVKLVDSRTVSRLPHHGPTGTFTGFELSNLGDRESLIDFIFIRGRITVLRHGTLSDTFDGFLPSDHFPVLAELAID
ncbi:MAG: endonuclease/exonuclease/phosphatase family protein [Acidobacteriota bacterium]